MYTHTHTNVGIERDIYAYIYMYTQIVCLMFYIFQVSLLDMQIISLFVIRLVCFAPVSWIEALEFNLEFKSHEFQTETKY